MNIMDKSSNKNNWITGKFHKKEKNKEMESIELKMKLVSELARSVIENDKEYPVCAILDNKYYRLKGVEISKNEFDTIAKHIMDEGGIYI